MTLTRGASITWYGHACIEVRSPEGKVLLIDPWFGNPLSPRRPGSSSSGATSCS